MTITLNEDVLNELSDNAKELYLMYCRLAVFEEEDNGYVVYNHGYHAGKEGFSRDDIKELREKNFILYPGDGGIRIILNLEKSNLDFSNIYVEKIVKLNGTLAYKSLLADLAVSSTPENVKVRIYDDLISIKIKEDLKLDDLEYLPRHFKNLLEFAVQMKCKIINVYMEE